MGFKHSSMQCRFNPLAANTAVFSSVISILVYFVSRFILPNSAKTGKPNTNEWLKAKTSEINKINKFFFYRRDNYKTAQIESYKISFFKLYMERYYEHIQ